MSETPKFKIYKRFDEAVADEGISFEVIDEHDNLWGSFRVGLWDEDSRSFKLARDRINADYEKLRRNKRPSNEEFVRDIFLEAILKGWENVLDEKDKPIPFTKANARAFFTMPGTSHVLSFLIGQAQDTTNFGTPDKDDVAGN